MIPSQAASILLILSHLFERGLKGSGFGAPSSPPLQCDCRCEVKIERAEAAVAVVGETKVIPLGTQLFKDFFGVALGACLTLASQVVHQRHVNGRRDTTAIEVTEGSPRHGLSPPVKPFSFQRKSW